MMEAVESTDGTGEMDSLVGTAWLAGHLEDDDLRVLDCTVVLQAQVDGTLRATSGRDLWTAGHIPGSGFADLTGEFSDPGSASRLILPAADRFAAAMGRLGVGVGTRVVLYDQHLNRWAARLWWMLRAFGFDAAAVLDGGWRAWTAEGRPCSTEPFRRAPAVFHARPRPGLIGDRDEVLGSLDDDDGGAARLLDALGPARQRGHGGRERLADPARPLAPGD